MSGILACPHGHQWESPADGDTLTCPVCGAAGAARAEEEATWRGSIALELPPPPQGSASAPTAPGESSETGELPTLPGYKIIGELGRGGMGVVYQARQLSLNRIVAIKMILPGAHLGPEELTRFRTEADAVARLQHPHIVQIHEVGEHQRRPYLCFEFVAGGNLARRIAGQPLQAVEAARLVEILARTVSFAHAQGIIHRDLKPANILLVTTAEAGQKAPDSPLVTFHSQLTTHQPKITDFGLAKRLNDTSSQTRTGVAMGTPSYMAPEQASGQSMTITPAVDIYALGAILYETVTGRPPFVGASPMETLHQLLYDEPVPPRRLQPRLPRDLETICLKCLRKDSAKRYASAEALAKDLRLFLANEPIRARPAGVGERAVRWCRRNPRVAVLLAALVLVFIAGFAAVTVEWLRADNEWRRAEALRKQAEESDRRTRRVLTDALASIGYEVEKSKVAELPLKEELLYQLIKNLGLLAASRPDDDAVQADLAVSHFCVGRIKVITGRYEEALKPYEEAIALQRSLLQKRPGVARYRRELAHSLTGIGNAKRLLDPGKDEARWQEVFDALQEALRLREQLAAENPDNLDAVRELGLSYEFIGFAHHAHRQSRQGLPFAEKAVELHRKTYAARPDSLDYRTDLGAALNDLALVLSKCDELERALTAHDEALNLPALPGSVRGQFKHRHLICVQHYNRGGVLLRLGRVEEAAEAARRAQLAVPDDLGNLHRVARLLALCATTLTKQGNPSDKQLLGQQFADEAMRVLHAAEELGLEPELLKSSDLAFLRSREDFKRLEERVKARTK
jgi:eukaryotic-like serine/threonine-protein kinase